MAAERDVQGIGAYRGKARRAFPIFPQISNKTKEGGGIDDKDIEHYRLYPYRGGYCVAVLGGLGSGSFRLGGAIMSLKEIRRQHGLTQGQTAAAIGIERPVYNLIENGKCLPLPMTAEALSQQFEGDISGLFPDIEDLFIAAAQAAKIEDLSADAQRVVALLPIGKANAISRAELGRLAGLGDRSLRKNIAEARRAGVLVVNSQRGEGYYIADEAADIRRQYMADRSRALSILGRLKTMKQILKEMEDN